MVISPVAWFWQDSLVPDTYSVMDMGYVDAGGGPAAPHHGTGPVSVSSLTGPRGRPADVSVTLVARKQRFRLVGGGSVDGYTLNNASPGPQLRAAQGQLVEVRLVNESVPDGVTLHWHGVDVPNAEDGVAGITQDAVRVGAEHVYRFVAPDAGTYWYHSHQVGHEQVRRGLFGALVVTPPKPDPGVVDVVAEVHAYDKQRTVGGQVGERRVAVPAGSRTRVRVINTDDAPMRTWATVAYRVVAVDGFDLHEPGPVEGTTVLVTAGGRVDLELTTPADGAPVLVGAGGGRTVLVLAPDRQAPAPPAAVPTRELDLLGYGTPAPLGFDPDAADRRFEYRIGRRPGFLDGVPGLWWTVNGRMFPDVPMYHVAEGDIVRMRLVNDSGEVHPMHLHGHHAVVLSRDGKPATGSPWWVDSLNVDDGESYEIAFVADNPGIWVDHCHNLPHAAEGLLAHLVYEGVTEPFKVGGPAHNQPE